MYDLLDQAHSYIDSFGRLDPHDQKRCWCATERPDARSGHFPGCVDLRLFQTRLEHAIIESMAKDEGVDR